jgi:hypothetical protein
MHFNRYTYTCLVVKIEWLDADFRGGQPTPEMNMPAQAEVFIPLAAKKTHSVLQA